MTSTRSLTGALGCSALIPLATLGWVAPAPVRSSSKLETIPIQTPTDPDLNVGTLLCAGRNLKDPNFAQTVILIVKYEEEGTLGLILNRRSGLPISKVLEDWNEAKGRTEPVYAGGPVDKSSLLGLLRSPRAKNEQIHSISRDVQLVSDRGQLQKILQSSTGSDKFRLYAGYAGWAAGQLEEEIDIGAWQVFPNDANLIFDSDPDSLWMRLIKSSETQIASFYKVRGGQGRHAPLAAFGA